MMNRTIACILLLAMAAASVASPGTAIPDILPNTMQSAGIPSPDASVTMKSITCLVANVTTNQVSQRTLSLGSPVINVSSYDTILFTAKAKYTGPAGTKGMLTVFDESTGQMIMGTELSPGVVTKMKVLKPFAFASGSHLVHFTMFGGGARQEIKVVINIIP